MASFRHLIHLGAALPVLALAACSGEGWEMVPFHGVPFDNERTAGAGVSYVRANMLPAKGPVVEEPAVEEVSEEEPVVEEVAEEEEAAEAVEPAEVEEPAPAPEPEPEIAEGDKVFDNKQHK